MRVFAAVWGIGGVAAILVHAIWTLTPKALGAFEHSLDWRHWSFAAVWLTMMAWTEGYRGFHRSFSPRVVERAGLLLRPEPLPPARGFLAPFYCMGFFHDTRRRKIVAWSLAIGIVVLVLVVRALPQPWRGLVDLGVIVGLSIGLLSLTFFTLKALARRQGEAEEGVTQDRLVARLSYAVAPGVAAQTGEIRGVEEEAQHQVDEVGHGRVLGG